MARRSRGRGASLPIKRPTSWLGIAAFAAVGVVLVKAFWPSADAKLSGLAADVKKMTDKTGESKAA